MPADADMPAPLDAAALMAALRWYVEMGVDIAIEETPRDRFADFAVETAMKAARLEEPAGAAPLVEARKAPNEGAPVRVGPAGAPPPPAVADAAQSARQGAAEARDLDELRAALEAFDGCALKRTASRLVFEDGARGARVMLVGEAPGGDEDKIGKPFVGRAGQLLDRMLAAIALDRSQVYIANVVPWRPPGNRAPSPQETAVCLPFILRQIALANPDILVCLGASSAQTLLGIREGITRARGTWRDFILESDPPRTIRALATLHPAYLLRTPSAKRGAWADLRALRKAIDAT